MILEAVEFVIILLHIPPFACWQAPPSWSAFHRSLQCLSSVPPTNCLQHTARAPKWSSFPMWIPTFPMWIPTTTSKTTWYSQPLTPRWSHVHSIFTLLLTKSKLSLSKSFKDQFKASLSKSSQWSAFLWISICFIGLISTYGNRWLAVCVFIPLKTVICFETWITCYILLSVFLNDMPIIRDSNKIPWIFKII